MQLLIVAEDTVCFAAHGVNHERILHYSMVETMLNFSQLEKSKNVLPLNLLRNYDASYDKRY